MTANQIAWQQHLEQKRHNLATEDLGNRTLSETVRSHRTDEGERHRSNTAQEAIGWFNAVSNRSHYERMDYENQRHNTVTESETLRHNAESENLQRFSNTTQNEQAAAQANYWRNMAEINQYDAETRRASARVNAINDTANTALKIFDTVVPSAEDFKDLALGVNNIVKSIIPFVGK